MLFRSLAAKAQADSAILARVTEMRTAKVKQKADDDLMDALHFTLTSTRPEDFDAAVKGPIQQYVDTYFKSGWGSGDKLVIKAFRDHAEMLAASHDYEGARQTVRYIMEHKIGNRKIAGRDTPELTKLMENIDDREQEHESRKYAIQKQQDDRVLTEAGLQIQIGRAHV